MANLTPGDCRISLARLTSLNNGFSKLTVGQLLAFDLTKVYVASIEMPDPQKQENEQFYPTSRGVGHVVKLGFEKGESTLEFEMLCGIFLYYAYGGCVTTNDTPSTGAYTHTLSEADTLPYFGLHVEQEHASYPVRKDLLGCTTPSVEVITEAGSDTPIMLNVEINCAIVIDGDDLAEPAALALDKFVRDNVTRLSLLYDSVAIESDMINQCDKHSFKIVNEIDYKQVFNSEFMGRIVVGKRTYEILYHVTTEVIQKWKNISNLAVPNFAAQYASAGKVTQDIIASGGGTTDLVLTNGLKDPVKSNITDYAVVHGGVEYTTVSYTEATKTLVLSGVGPADAEIISLTLTAQTDVITSGGGSTDLVLTTGLTGGYVSDIATNYLVKHGSTYYDIVSYTSGTKTLVLDSVGPADAQVIEIVKAQYYAGPIALDTMIVANVNRSIRLQCSKLRLDPFKINLPSWEEKTLEMDFNLKAAPGNVGSGIIIDALSNLYYEGA